MDDKTSSKPTPDPRHPHGGDKDTNDLHDIKDVQKTGMQEKARQVDDLPADVTGADQNLPRQNR
ncbi:hypothetical protein [Deinococcus alpinitundrae]|uniref:hypothetical protein n=1 Tax=Deinococcus alpinitundrae TaxID=468913 RepID=UPI001379C329|nr:hypothetical protein [Deinococcus alpinitundrae]